MTANLKKGTSSSIWIFHFIRYPNRFYDYR